MPELSCRNLIRRAATVSGAAVVASVAPATGALAGPAPRRGRHGDIRDIKHVVAGDRHAVPVAPGLRDVLRHAARRPARRTTAGPTTAGRASTARGTAA